MSAIHFAVPGTVHRGHAPVGSPSTHFADCATCGDSLGVQIHAACGYVAIAEAAEAALDRESALRVALFLEGT